MTVSHDANQRIKKNQYLNKLSKNKVMQPQFSCNRINSKKTFLYLQNQCNIYEENKLIFKTSFVKTKFSLRMTFASLKLKRLTLIIGITINNTGSVHRSMIDKVYKANFWKEWLRWLKRDPYFESISLKIKSFNANVWSFKLNMSCMKISVKN